MSTGWIIPDVAAFGFRFGVTLRCVWLSGSAAFESGSFAQASGPCAIAIPQRQSTVPEMYLDVLASDAGMHDTSDEALRVELNRAVVD